MCVLCCVVERVRAGLLFEFRGGAVMDWLAGLAGAFPLRAAPRDGDGDDWAEKARRFFFGGFSLSVGEIFC